MVQAEVRRSIALALERVDPRATVVRKLKAAHRCWKCGYFHWLWDVDKVVGGVGFWDVWIWDRSSLEGSKGILWKHSIAPSYCLPQILRCEQG